MDSTTLAVLHEAAKTDLCNAMYLLRRLNSGKSDESYKSLSPRPRYLSLGGSVPVGSRHHVRDGCRFGIKDIRTDSGGDPHRLGIKATKTHLNHATISQTPRLISSCKTWHIKTQLGWKGALVLKRDHSARPH